MRNTSNTLTEKPVLVDSISAAENLFIGSRFVGFDGGYCLAGAKAKGVLVTPTRVGEQAPVGVIGLQIVEAGGEVQAGDEVQSDETARAVVLSELGRSNGIAHTSADVAGDKILVLLK